MALDMKKVREQAPNLYETFDRESFEFVLKQRDLQQAISYIDVYTDAGWISPLEIGNKLRYHRGHMLILLRLMKCNTLPYQAGLSSAYDEEDILSRRIYLCESSAKHIREDAKKIQQIFQWLFGVNKESFEMNNAILTKTLIDISLDEIDPNGFYENLHRDGKATGIIKLVSDLVTMQKEVSNIVSIASGDGTSIPNVQFIYDRKRQMDELATLMMPLESPFLATPCRDITVDERLEFLQKRNELLAEKKYQALIEYYQAHLHYYESDVQYHARLCVCMGHIYGDLLKDSERAAAAFQEALEYDPSNTEAFNEVSRHLKNVERWSDLVDLLSNHWDTIDNVSKRCELIRECAQIQAFKCQNVEEALGLYERCMLEGEPGCEFDNLYKIIFGLMDNFTDLDKMRAIVTLSLHIVNFTQRDKVIALKQKYDTSHEALGCCMSSLIDAGIKSFEGDQPEALNILKTAIAYSPRTKLSDGILLRVASKMHSVNEFRESFNDLENESLSKEDFAYVWLRVAKDIRNIPALKELSLEYAEKSVSAIDTNEEAIALCYDIATSTNNLERAYVYATLQAVRTKDAAKSAELDNTCQELRLALADDEDKLVEAYIALYQFEDTRDDASKNLQELASDLDTEKSIALLQSIESYGMSPLVKTLYQSILERNISTDLKKGLLERYIGILLSQGHDLDVQEFIPIHAQLYALAPSDRLFTMLKTVTSDNKNALRQWTNILEDAFFSLSDNKRHVAKLLTTLADCYNILSDAEKLADTLTSLLKIAPDNAPAFRCCFAANENLERYNECTEIARAFKFEKLEPNERYAYALKSLIFSFVFLFDTSAMKYFLDILVQEDESKLPAVVDTLIDKAAAGKLAPEQMIHALETLEQDSNGLTKLLLRLARAKVSAQNDALDTANLLLNRETYEAVQKHKLLDRVKPTLELLQKSSHTEYQDTARRWLSPETKEPSAPKLPAAPILPPAASPSQDAAARRIDPIVKPAAEPANKEPSAPKLPAAPILPPAASPSQDAAANRVELCVKQCAEHISSEDFTAQAETILKSLSNDDASAAYIKLSEICESNKKYASAEVCLQKAFQLTKQADPLFEFYKRMRQFKKAYKICVYKYKNASELEKNNIKRELALLKAQLHDYDSAISLIDELIQSKTLDPAAHIAALRQKSAWLLESGKPQDAIEVLRTASADADKKVRDDIDIEICFLLREVALPDAKKLWQSIALRGVKSEFMTLLSLMFDIDADKYSEAETKIETLLKSENPIVKLQTLEQKLRLQTKREDAKDDLVATAKSIYALDNQNVKAREILGV